MMDHATRHRRHAADIDWTAMAAQLELEAEGLLAYVTETAAQVAGLCRQDTIEVQRILAQCGAIGMRPFQPVQR